LVHVASEVKRSNVVDQVGPTGPRLLRVDDVADRLAISRSMAWKIVSSGEMRSVRIGRAVRVRPSDLESYIADPARER
jgi:excisionase family DNA binding protein